MPGKAGSTAVITLAALIGSWQPRYASDLVIAMPNWPFPDTRLAMIDVPVDVPTTAIPARPFPIAAVPVAFAPIVFP